MISTTQRSPLVTDNFSYGAFGEGGRGVGAGYTGRWGTDAHKGRLRNWNRWYDSNYSVWISRDPAGTLDGPNLYSYVRNTPTSYFDSSGLERSPFSLNFDCPPCEAASQFFGNGFDAWRAKDLWGEATDLTKALAKMGVLPNNYLHNDEADAFRHCYWSCRMSQSIGPESALGIAGVHEKCSPNPPNETAMDMHNNAFGVRIPSDYRTDCRGRCLQALLDKKLISRP